MDLLDLLSPPPPPNPSQKLFTAASRGHIDQCMQYMQSTDVNVTDKINGLNSLHIAVKKNHIHIVECILSYYPSLISSLTDDGRTCMMIAAYEGHHMMIRVLLLHIMASDTSNTLNCKPCDGLNVSDALHEKYQRPVEWNGEEYEVVHAVDQAGNTAIHYAAWGGHVNAIQVLLQECGANPDCKNKEGMSPLDFAVAGDHTDALAVIQKALSKSSGSENQPSEGTAQGLSPLHRAAMHGATETLVVLISQGADPSCRGTSGNTALHLAAQRGKEECVKALLETTVQGGHDVANDFGLTPLHFACLGGHVRIFEKLLHAGASPFSRTEAGSSALHLAASAGSHEMSAVLAAHFSERGQSIVDTLDNDELSPIDMALSSGYKNLASRLAQWAYLSSRTQAIYKTIPPIENESAQLVS